MDTTYQILNVASDTIYVAIKNADIPATTATSSSLKLLYGACATIASAVLSALVTLRVKKTQFENFSKNLNLQKQLFEETKSNNENKIKAELVRLNDLKRQYELSLKKFDFEQIQSVLSYADSGDDKVKMMKDFSAFLLKYNPSHPSYIEDYGEYQEYISYHTYYRIEDIYLYIDKLLAEYPTAFTSIHSEFEDVAASAKSIKSHSTELHSYNDAITDDQVIHKICDDLFSLHENFNGLLNTMKSDYNDLDKARRKLIKNQVSK